ncbi:MAG: XrtA/PEP-CTERM system exopolysaccharide export protein [Steroidobacteraceae bacterium]
MLTRVLELLGIAAFCLPAVSPAQSAPTTAAAQTGAPAELPPQEASSQYQIGPGDPLEVFVWRNADLSQTVPVRPDGRISTPLVENMAAAGKTPSQLARDIEAVLSEYIRTPKVNIIVTHPLSVLSEVKVVGQVGHPQAIPFHEGLTVLDVVLQAGGLGPFAAGNRAELIRTENGKTHEVRIKLVNLMQKGDLTQNLPVKPGDVIVVPQTLF